MQILFDPLNFRHLHEQILFDPLNFRHLHERWERNGDVDAGGRYQRALRFLPLPPQRHPGGGPQNLRKTLFTLLFQ